MQILMILIWLIYFLDFLEYKNIFDLENIYFNIFRLNNTQKVLEGYFLLFLY